MPRIITNLSKEIDSPPTSKRKKTSNKKSCYGPLYKRLATYQEKQNKKIKKQKKKVESSSDSDRDSKNNSSSFEKIIIKKKKKKLKEGNLYTVKNGKLVQVEIEESSIEDDLSSEEVEYIPVRSVSTRIKPTHKNKKVLKSLNRKYKNKKKLQSQMIEQQKRIDKLENDNKRYCLVDYSEDFNTQADRRNNYIRGNSSFFRTPQNKFTFKIKSASSGRLNSIQVDDDLFISCSCYDWQSQCKSLGIMCKHIVYLNKVILKFSLFEIEDNRYSDSLKFYDSLTNIKYDYSAGVVVDNSQNGLCLICYKTTLKKNLWTWSIDWRTAVTCPTCRKPVHKDCARRWVESSLHKTCPHCNSYRFQNII